MHVLLVEPDILEAGVYAEILRRDGHTVSQARTAQAAVHLADKRRPDVVVLELQIPMHNGVEFLYEFRSYSEWLDIPVVVHTYVPMRELTHTKTLVRELGVTRILHKPDTKLAQLCDAVRQASFVKA